MADLIIAEEVQLKNPEGDYESLKTVLEAKANAEVNVKLSSGEQVLLNTQFLNLCKDKIQRIDRHFWFGSVVTDRPTLSSGYYTVLTQKGTKPEGVKWGQVWANGPADDTTARKWVVAFDTAAGKAYAEAGPMGPVDWNVIEVKLAASESKTEYKDPILGGEALATIDGLKAYALCCMCYNIAVLL